MNKPDLSSAAKTADSIIPLSGALSFHLSAGDPHVDGVIHSIREKLDLIERSIGKPSTSTQSQDQYTSVISGWNDIASGCGLPMCHATQKRKDLVRTRLKDKSWASLWQKAIEKIPNCPFLIGKNNRGWKANIDWFLRPDSVFKILEGQYDGAESGPSLGDLISQKRALDDEIHNHRENRDGPAFRFGRSTPEGREEFAALKAKREEVTRRISSMNGPA